MKSNPTLPYVYSRILLGQNDLPVFEPDDVIDVDGGVRDGAGDVDLGAVLDVQLGAAGQRYHRVSRKLTLIVSC